MKVTTRALVVGLSSYLPPLYKRLMGGTGGSDSSRYCYSTWMRHMVMAHKHGLPTDPKVIAELGPGDSIGLGLMALLTGTEFYYAFDVVTFANLDRNLKIFEELIELFRKREPVPDEKEFPHVRPRLDSYIFPREIFPDSRLEAALQPARLERIRASIRNNNDPQSVIKYMVPWYDAEILQSESVDFIFSQAVLEHVDQLRGAYKSMHSWLKPEGFMSHQIDFKSHKTSDAWNGHWAYSDFHWRLIRGRQAFLLNRQPYATHLKMLREEGFTMIGDAKDSTPSGIPRGKLAPRFKSISEDDLNTSAAFVLARKTVSEGVPENHAASRLAVR